MNPWALSSRLINTPVMIDPRTGKLAFRLLEGVGSMSASKGDYPTGADAEGLQVVCGIAVIPIKGVLIQRVGSMAWLADMFGISGYDRIRELYIEAQADESIDAIVLDIDSGGGEVAGCFDLVDTIYACRGNKPTWAILGENAYSAAYAIASAADRITVPRTGGTGSVGVITMHVSMEEALKKEGIEVTIITKGDLKGDGNQFSALSDDAFARIKAEVDILGDLFDATVARNRGMKQSDVFDTQAGTFLGAQGVKVGFADAVMAPDEAFRDLLSKLD